MENIEKLPILKTAWAVNKQFFKSVFKPKALLFFVLPLMVVSFLQFEFQNSVEIQTYVIEQAELTQEPVADDVLSMWFASVVGLMVFGIVTWVVGIFAAVGWHRMMICSEDLTLNGSGRGEFIKGYLKDSLWLLLLGIFYYLAITLLITLVVASQGWLLLSATSSGASAPTWLLPVLMFLVGIAVVALIVRYYSFCLCLPAAAVGKRIKFKELKMVFKSKLRLFVTTMLTALIPMGVFMALLASLVASYTQLMSGVDLSQNVLPPMDTPLAYWFVMFVLGLWMVYMSLGVLSMFYMHYIVPQLPAIEKAREEKSLGKSEDNKPSSDE